MAVTAGASTSGGGGAAAQAGQQSSWSATSRRSWRAIHSCYTGAFGIIDISSNKALSRLDYWGGAGSQTDGQKDLGALAHETRIRLRDSVPAADPGEPRPELGPELNVSPPITGGRVSHLVPLKL